uniref:PIH1 domain-containing protein n=1 Tax=Angiostrongylus cantonensis TaxID=6313 RepID=A0A0K0CUP5_ANGCA
MTTIKINEVGNNIAIYIQVNVKEIFGETKEHKCFLNICHCAELPPPVDDIDEDELAARIDKGDIGFRIPVSIGELDSVVDNKNTNQAKIDVLVNSTFYAKRLAPPNANFFRHFFCMVVCEAIEDKHHLKLDPNKCIKLKNRTLMGYIEPMKIMKRPVAPVIQEITSTVPSGDIAVLKYLGIQQPTGVHICLFKGTKLMIELFLKDEEISAIHR